MTFTDMLDIDPLFGVMKDFRWNSYPIAHDYGAKVLNTISLEITPPSCTHGLWRALQPYQHPIRNWYVWL